MLPTSQSWSSGFDRHNSAGMISPFTAVTNQHPTPPRLNGNTLPSTPSSERLRAIAPSPITVIPRSRLRYSPPSPSRANGTVNHNNTPPRRPPRPSVAQALSFNLRQQERAVSVYSEGEDEVSAIVQSYMRLSNSHTEGGQSDEDDDIQVPIILDNGTPAAQAAIRRNLDRSAIPQAIPEEIEDVEFLNVEPTPREEEENMTPGEFYRAHYKPQVMVRFNTHIFGQPAPGESNDENDNGPPEAESPGSQYDNDDDDEESSDRKASTTSSWYVPERRLTDFSDFYREQSLRDNAVNEDDEEDNDTTPGVFSSTLDPLAASVPPAAQIEAPALEESDKTSPESFNTELITPAHDDVPLPIPPRGSSDQGVARPNMPLDGIHVDKRFLPAKSSFRPSTAPIEKPSNILAPATTLLKRPKLIAPTPRGNTAEGLQLDTTGRRSIDVDRERAIEHAGGTPGRPSRLLEDRNTPPVPPLPQHLMKVSKPTTDEAGEAEALTPDEISKILAEVEDPDIEACAASDEKSQEVDLPSKPWPEDLARVDRTTKLELIVNQDSGMPVWCSLPIRRLSRPEYWQQKEDQELATAIRWRDPPPKPQPFQQTGAVIFGQPPKSRTQWTFFYTSKSMPTLKGVMINDGTGKDHTRGKIKLNIKEEGVYQASGYDEAGNVEWMFEYLVTKRQAAKSRRSKRARNVYPMYFYAVAAFLDPSRGQTLFPFSKAFQPVYEAERMPVARVGQPPVHTSPPEWNIEEVKLARRTAAEIPPVQGPPVSAVGRVFGAITGIKRSRPNTPAATDKFPKPLTSSRPGTASPAGGQVDSSGTTPVRSGGLLGGLKNKLAKRPGTSAGIVSIAPPSHSAPLALGSRDDLRLQRFDTNASVKSGTGKSLKSMISKIGLRPSSRPGSAREGHFPRYDQVRSLAPIQPAPGLGRRRSKSAASALFPARISPSPLGFVQEEPVSSQNGESAKAESAKSDKTIMGRIRTLSVGARPNSRAKSPLAIESLAVSDPVESAADVSDSTKPKTVMGRLRSLSSASRPGSSRVTPVDHPNFDLEELLSAREAAGSAFDTHDPLTSLVKHTRGLSGSLRPGLPRSYSSSSQISDATARPGIPRSQSNTSQLSSVIARPNLLRTESNTSQISPTPPFVLEELLRERAIGPSDSLAASVTSSPILGPAKWKGKGREVVPELRPGSSGRPGSSREAPVWFAASQANVGSSKSINTVADSDGPSSSSSATRVLPVLQKVANRVTSNRGEGSHRGSISLKHSSLSVQDIAEYVDGKFSSSTISAISLDDRSGSDTGSDDIRGKPVEGMTFEDAVEMSSRRRGLGPSTSRENPSMVAIKDQNEQSEFRPEPLARKNTFERLLTAGETLTIQAINTSVQRIVEENHLAPIEEAKPSTIPRLVEKPLTECVALPQAIPRIKSLSSIDPNIPRYAPTPALTAVPKVTSSGPRSRPSTADSYGTPRDKENDAVYKPSKLNVVATPVPPTPAPSFWQRLTRPRSLSNLRATSAPLLAAAADAPPLPPLPRAAQPIVPSPSLPSDDTSARYQSAKSMGKMPATSNGPTKSSLPRSSASSTTLSNMANSASTTGVVLLQNVVPAHMKDQHPFAVAIRPIEGRIPGSEWTNLNPQPTHYLVEDLVFKRAMEKHREEMRTPDVPPARIEGGSRPDSASSSGSRRPPLRPILRKRPNTTQTEQIPQEHLDPTLPHHLRPNRWNPRDVSPVPSPLSSRRPIPPRRGRPSTAQIQR